MTVKKPRRPEFRQPCECGACPQLPTRRPPTLKEAYDHYAHDGWFPQDKCFYLAVDTHVISYAMYVNCKGWRKPRNWAGEKLALNQLIPADRTISPEEMRTVISKLLKGGARAAGLG